MTTDLTDESWIRYPAPIAESPPSERALNYTKCFTGIYPLGWADVCSLYTTIGAVASNYGPVGFLGTPIPSFPGFATESLPMERVLQHFSGIYTPCRVNSDLTAIHGTDQNDSYPARNAESLPLERVLANNKYLPGIFIPPYKCRL